MEEERRSVLGGPPQKDYRENFRSPLRADIERRIIDWGVKEASEVVSSDLENPTSGGLTDGVIEE